MIIIICLFVVNKCQCWNWRDKSNEADCNPTQILLNLSKQERENCSRRWCQNMAQSVGENSCVITAISCQLCAHVLHSFHVPAERAFVLLGSLNEQTEHEESVICLSVCLYVVDVTAAATGNASGMTHISASTRWSACLLTKDQAGSSLIGGAQSCLTSSVRLQIILCGSDSLDRVRLFCTVWIDCTYSKFGDKEHRFQHKKPESLIIRESGIYFLLFFFFLFRKAHPQCTVSSTTNLHVI